MINWSLIEPDKAHQNLKQIVSTVRGGKNLPIGSLVLVQIVESSYHSENTEEWVYARIAKKPEGSMLFLYLTPDETQISTFEIGRVVPIPQNTLENHFIPDEILKVSN